MSEKAPFFLGGMESRNFWLNPGPDNNMLVSYRTLCHWVEEGEVRVYHLRNTEGRLSAVKTTWQTHGPGDLPLACSDYSLAVFSKEDPVQHSPAV